jgi:hypothetical protein
MGFPGGLSFLFLFLPRPAGLVYSTATTITLYLEHSNTNSWLKLGEGKKCFVGINAYIKKNFSVLIREQEMFNTFLFSHSNVHII